MASTRLDQEGSKKFKATGYGYVSSPLESRCSGPPLHQTNR